MENMLINDYYVEAGLFASAYVLEAKQGSCEQNLKWSRLD